VLGCSLAALLASPPRAARAQATVPGAAGAPAVGALAVDMLHVPGRDVTVSLLTMGNGEAVWEMFGHTAIRIHDNPSGRDTVFNWGEFDMRAPHFILHFLQGLNWYQMGGQTMDSLLRAYRYWNRSVTSQTLDLSDAQKDSLIAIIRTNAQPENLRYRYDYFVDNCSTRPRDILDQVLGGQFRVGADAITNTSYRYHALRLMQGNAPLVVGVDIGLGEPSDRPITRWQEMFLPKQLHDWAATRMIRDSTGATRPLVMNEQVLYQSSRPLEFEAPPNLAPWLTGIGLILGMLFLVLGFRGASLAAAIAFGAWSLVCGLLGVLLTALWAVTDHRFAHSNENLLLFNPLWLVLVVMLPLYLRRDRAPAVTRALVFALAGLSVLALLAHVVMVSRQANLAVIGLALPPALAIVFVVAKRFRVSTD
jgi:uncharacterized protein DUF4105